jgi:hypothetical protein
MPRDHEHALWDLSPVRALVQIFRNGSGKNLNWIVTPGFLRRRETDGPLASWSRDQLSRGRPRAARTHASNGI